MYKNILVAVALQVSGEQSPHALAAREVAISMAGGGEKAVTVLTVYNLERVDGHHEFIPTIDEMSWGQALAEKEREEREAERIQKIEEQVNFDLNRFVVEFHNQGVNTRQMAKEGDPRELIVRTAVEIKADLIIMGAHARRGFMDVLLGGTARAVAEKAPCAVIMVKPEP